VKTTSTTVLVRAGLLAVLCSPLWCAVSSSAQQSQGSTENSEVKHDESPRLTDIPGIPPQAGPNHEMRRHQPRQIKAGPSQADPAIQTVITTFAAPTAGINFDGVGNGVYGYTVNSAPPDTNGAVGPNHYVQWVNTSFAVFNKSGGLVWGPFNGNTLWSGFGGGCQANNDGDPIVQYDKIADRWIFMQFSVTAPYPYTVCMAVSTTPDPTGSYYRYEFSGFGTEFPDYPKLAVWPDGYYATYNLFNNGVIFTGPRFCSYDRSKMLTGAVATQQCFTLGSQFGGDLPSDIDGKTLPPAGSPDYILEFGTNALNLWKFHVDWTTPANTTLTGPTSIPVAAFSAACNGGGTCIPQGGTTQQLDSLADRVMYRLAYRNFGDHEALVVNHSVTAGSSVGVRWYEIRSPGGTPTVFQQGTYAPDAGYRWMGSIAMDRAGDIGLGYSISSSTTHPGIRYTGRLVTDALNTLQAEASIIDGAGSQTGGLSRWGDYSSITVDPVDDCTFWYTNEYIPANGSFNWRTRIASFKFASCGTPDYAVAASPASQSVVQGSSTSYTVTVTPSGGFTGTVSFSVSGLPAGAAATFNPTSVPGSGTSTMSVTTSSTTPTGSYPLTIAGTSGTLTHTASVTLVVTAPVTPNFSLSASPASQSVVQGSSTSYTVTITPSGGFTGSVTLSASGLPAGAAASFAPNPATSTSTMSVTTSSTTPTGSYPLTITGTSGTLSHTASVTLIVTAAATPNFTLSASPSSQTVTQGASTSYTVTITPSGGFTGSVTFSASGLPAGATASFAPNPATSTSSMTVTTATTTPAGSYPLTITGVSGTLSHTASVTLVVTAAGAGNFSLSATPASQSIPAGASTTYTINVTRTGGFTGGVTLSATGVPAGATATFSPNPATGASSTLTVATSGTTPVNTFTITVTGTSGTLSHTTTVSLTVTAAPCTGECDN